MKTLFDEYSHLFPTDRINVLFPILSKVAVMRIPEDPLHTRRSEKHNTVLVYRDKTKYIVELLANGYEHAVCEAREDFASELLYSAIMALKPEIFLANPLSFFMNSFDSTRSDLSKADKHLTVNFDSTDQKSALIESMVNFWSKDPAAFALHDIGLQVVDEMFTNIFFNAPIDAKGTRPLKQQDRATRIRLPERFKAKLFSCLTDDKLIIGCEDPFGSLSRNEVMFRLESIFMEAMTSPRFNTSGAGLGLKFLTENSASFYLFCEKGKKTVFACGLLLKGLKANLKASKNIHFVVR